MQTTNDYKYWIQLHSGWFLIVLFCLIAIIGQATTSPLTWSISHVQLTLSSIGKVAGIIAYILFAINMVTSLRQKWLEKLFGGMNRVYIAHHITGGIALALACFHPLFLALNFINFRILSTFRNFSQFFIPHAYHATDTLVQAKTATAFNCGIIGLYLMLGLLILTFYVKLPYNLWLFSHKFLGLSFGLIIIHTLFRTTGWFFGYMLLWGAIGVAAFVYRSVFGSIYIRREPYQVKEVIAEPGQTVHITLEPIRKKIQFEPGQFVFISFLWDEQRDHIPTETHPFSIASSPDEKELSLHIKSLGDFTNKIKHLSPGTIAEVEGAFGGFIPSRFTDRDQVWIAGGIGITPFLAMAHHYKASDPNVTLVYGVRSHTELLEEPYLTVVLPIKNKGFKFVPYVSAEHDSAHLDAKFISEAAGGLENKEIFICGPPVMMKSIRKDLNRLGVPNRLIHDEVFTIQ